jgi:mono/diheme cytochrome c family protein
MSNVSLRLLLPAIPVFCLVFGATWMPSRGQALLQELACGNCHGGIEPSAELFDQAPSLSFAGLRYRPGFLFDYLSKPQQVRPHLGRARMPDFNLSERERLALTLFLSEQRQTDRPLPSFPLGLHQDVSLLSHEAADRLIKHELSCISCHTWNGVGEERAGELMLTGVRLRPSWLREYLAMPQAFEPNTAMPATFYQLSEDGRGLEEMVHGSEQKIAGLVTYLDSAAAGQRAIMERRLSDARSMHPDVTAEMGRKAFVALNCAACHRHTEIVGSRNAPDLLIASRRVKPAWLTSYLARPMPIRPSGYHPGTGSRMPDYQLREDERAAIIETLMPEREAIEPIVPLSLFAEAKASRLLHDQLACLGCHALEGKGGNIGPDLLQSSSRLRTQYLREVIADPGGTNPASIMPRAPLTEVEAELIVRYLATRKPSVQATEYVSLTDTPLRSPEDTVGVRGLYLTHCSPCHGLTGNGDGFNAQSLPVRPTPHASASSMAERGDDTLFDGISGGGGILGKHHFMPSFGETLSRDEIVSLVRYIRELCQCEPPAWSRAVSTGAR